MVGGEVIKVLYDENRPEETKVVCAEYRRNRKGEKYRDDANATYVWVKDPDRKVQVGDTLWWQEWKAYWTPSKSYQPNQYPLRCGVDYDIELERTSYSCVYNPVIEDGGCI